MYEDTGLQTWHADFHKGALIDNNKKKLFILKIQIDHVICDRSILLPLIGDQPQKS